MNSTSAVEVSIQAVSPELIFDESRENGAVGAAGAASEAAAADAGAAADAAAALVTAALVTAALAASALGADAVAAAAEAFDASSANAALTPPARSEAAIARDIKNLRIFRFLLLFR
jgi:hypothetical protein